MIGTSQEIYLGARTAESGLAPITFTGAFAENVLRNDKLSKARNAILKFRPTRFQTLFLSDENYFPDGLKLQT